MRYHKYWETREGLKRSDDSTYTIGEVAADYQYNFDLGLTVAVDAVALLSVGQVWSDGSASWLRVS